MKRILLLEPSIVERFADWARETGRHSFWGVAKTGGRLCLLLNSAGPSGYRVLLITGVDNDNVYLVAGYPEDGEENDETTIGSLTDDPGQMLKKSVRWMLDLAHEYHHLSLHEASADLARVAQSVAEHTGDVLSAAEAVILGAEAAESDNFG